MDCLPYLILIHLGLFAKFFVARKLYTKRLTPNTTPPIIYIGGIQNVKVG